MRPLLVLASLLGLLAMAGLGVVVLARSAGQAVDTDERAAADEATSAPSGPAYNLVAADGTMYRFGEPRTTGDLAGRAGVRRLVAVGGDIAGFWTITGSGRVFAVGRAPGAGSLASIDLSAPLVGLAAAPDRSGYWLAGADGGVFAQGTVAFHGSAAGLAQDRITDIAPTPSGQGYWLLAADGGLYSFGDATFRGAPVEHGLATPAVAMAPTSSGNGYWIVTQAGSVYTYGDAAFHGAATELTQGVPVVDIAALESGAGYWLTASDGAVFAFGAAPFLGAAPGLEAPPTAPIIGMVATAG